MIKTIVFILSISLLTICEFYSSEKLSNISQKDVVFYKNNRSIKGFDFFATNEEIMNSGRKSSAVGFLITGSVFTSLSVLTGGVAIGIGSFAYIAENISVSQLFLMFYGIGAGFLGAIVLTGVFLAIGLPILIFGIVQYAKGLKKTVSIQSELKQNSTSLSLCFKL